LDVQQTKTEKRRLGVALVGLGGAVATTAVAGIELLRLAGSETGAGTEGLPLAGLRTADGRRLAEVAGLAPYTELIFAGWDLAPEDLAKAVEVHGVLDRDQREAVGSVLAGITPWPAVGSTDFCSNVTGEHAMANVGHRAAVAVLTADLEHFRSERRLDGLVVVNVASTERVVDREDPALATPESFEHGLDVDDPAIGRRCCTRTRPSRPASRTPTSRPAPPSTSRRCLPSPPSAAFLSRGRTARPGRPR